MIYNLRWSGVIQVQEQDRNPWGFRYTYLAFYIHIEWMGNPQGK
jgi:hypothetical protein